MDHKIGSWRKSTPHVPLFGTELSPYPATRFFDQLSYIGDPNVCCFVLETGQGHIMIDCMEPTDEYVAMIEKGFDDLGLKLEDLRAIIITHGHGDHFGKADYFREKYGCTIYMSKVDYEFARTDYSSRMGEMKFEVQDFLEDNDVFRLGESEIYCVSTPGHSPGGLSFIFPVTDEGRPHMVGIWGGTGIPRSEGEREQYLASIRRFMKITEEKGCDVEISAHPFVDNMIGRLEVVRHITNGTHNPFIVGTDGFQYGMRSFEQMCLEAMEKGRA